ncbi:hypothetical protein BQ8794_110134 [Mesorhizobium prunaredense]|uniref:Uncharacterized protein n=1 Tax=Mesorhizobium prunaredense TaxID=1631249 RepID=A0A1R3V0C7_9HYPH|nr:hypothetical protein [Mesorhizobium prunaredense]SIT53328.1 hypothetical protein BQ8794_110134 [Mesorhizobium prunaredense]
MSGVTLEGRILQGGWERLVQIGDATQLGRLRFSRVIIDGSDENDRAGVTKLEERGFRTLHEPTEDLPDFRGAVVARRLAANDQPRESR